jgi:hypothetical protein
LQLDVRTSKASLLLLVHGQEHSLFHFAEKLMNWGCQSSTLTARQFTGKPDAFFESYQDTKDIDDGKVKKLRTEFNFLIWA